MKWRFFGGHDNPPLEGTEHHDAQTQGKEPRQSEGNEDRETRKGDTMLDELITADNVSKELLKSVFDAAFMDTAYDKDGDLFVRDRCTCFVFCDKEKRVVYLRSYFRLTASASEIQRLTCANEINGNYLLVRAIVSDHTVMFGHDIALDGGISKKALVLLLKRFCRIPHDAVGDYGKDIVE